MKCVIPGPNVKGKNELLSKQNHSSLYFYMVIMKLLEKTIHSFVCLLILVLARAIHALCRIGDELYVEPEPAKLSFRAVSASKSAYASFSFSESFFSYYNYEQTKSQEEDVTCKVSMKVLYFYIDTFLNPFVMFT